MIFITLNKNKLYIKFDRIVSTAKVSINDNELFSITKIIRKTDFETFEIPKKIKTLIVNIKTKNNSTNKIFNLK